MVNITPQKQAEMICDLFLMSPQTKNDCLVSSALINNGDGTYSFIVRDIVDGSEWLHTVLTSEYIESDFSHREALMKVVAKLFAKDSATRFTSYVYQDDTDIPLPEGKKIAITVEYRDINEE